MKTIMRISIIIVTFLFLIWIAITIWVQSEGEKSIQYFGSTEAIKKALIVYDPDPFYNFVKPLGEHLHLITGMLLSQV
jgi:hypothetical protein